MKKYNEELYSTETEWNKNRGIGGSDLAKIFNKNKYGDINELYDRLVLGKIKEIPQNKRMIEGKKAETHIRELVALDLGDTWKLISPPKRKFWLFRSFINKYITYTPDGLLLNKKAKQKFILEVKDIELRTRKDIEDWSSGAITPQYLFQLLQGLIVLNDFDGCLFVVHLKHYKQQDNEWVFDYSEERLYWLYRVDCIDQIEKALVGELKFISTNIEGRVRPKTILNL